jgi:hypothetical protein
MPAAIARLTARCSLRETPLMGTLLVIHLATVLALFVSAPSGKFAHFVYRFAALQNRRKRAESRIHRQYVLSLEGGVQDETGA